MNGYPEVVPSKPAGIGQIIDVVAHAMQVFGDGRTALRWFRTPVPSFDDETPQERL